jgi:hypothetical protein
MCTADISTHEVFSTCTERNVGLGNFHSLAIGLGFDMLSETPAIIARSDISPPDVAFVFPDRRRFF